MSDSCPQCSQERTEESSPLTIGNMKQFYSHNSEHLPPTSPLLVTLPFPPYHLLSHKAARLNSEGVWGACWACPVGSGCKVRSPTFFCILEALNELSQPGLPHTLLYAHRQLLTKQNNSLSIIYCQKPCHFLIPQVFHQR